MRPVVAAGGHISHLVQHFGIGWELQLVLTHEKD
jgi:hypothetical protein